MNSNFLKKLAQENTLRIQEPSNNLATAYITKATNCVQASNLLAQNNLYENAISSAYYAMYNALQALLYKTGIKCLNHTASIHLLKHLYDQQELHRQIQHAKKERIDKQYYVTDQEETQTQQDTQELIQQAQDFVTHIRLLVDELTEQDYKDARKKLQEDLQ